MRSSQRSNPEAGTAERVARTQEQLKALAWLLDSSIRLPGGFRIGLDALIGLVPFFGDAAGVLMSGYIVSQAAKLGVPRSILFRMVVNVAIEGAVGLIPFVGDVFDAAWKANQRNVALLERHLADPVRTARSSRRVVALAVGGMILLTIMTSTLSMLLMRWIWNAIQT